MGWRKDECWPQEGLGVNQPGGLECQQGSGGGRAFLRGVSGTCMGQSREGGKEGSTVMWEITALGVVVGCGHSMTPPAPTLPDDIQILE